MDLNTLNNLFFILLSTTLIIIDFVLQVKFDGH